ncbi:glucosamine inositolphosphorylceramide transferase family protein [Fulvivirga lutimaris]|uniref:glucosamine inositolphosphorylceramide transferase family protein n=1 Tax=Fulvivirga lutimaris TaxID=1819566 RepID=UPI0012BB7CAE|nr:hypothetical protein [Fulvivirga lutimaris]MTI38197.1 hypothetical protein [Fulvivirga lutimaris]
MGLLVDDFNMSGWQAAIVDFILKDYNLSLCVVILNESDKKSSIRSSFVYRSLMKLDRLIFKIPNAAFSKVDKREELKNTQTITIKSLSKGFYSCLKEEDIKRVKGLELDLLIRFGFGILNGGVLNAAKYGVWSLHHGDSAINRGGPPAFWEVVKQEAVTGITLQRLSSDLDGGKVIGKSFIKTDSTSFTRNLDAALWAGVQLFSSKIDELATGRLKLEERTGLGFYSKPLYKNPGNAISTLIFLKFWLRRVKELYQNLFHPQQWSLAYKFKRDNGQEKSMFRYKLLTPPKNYDWADPFVIKHENKYHLFFEELNRSKGMGQISYMQFDNDGSLIPNSKSIVIKEDYHLSYPFVFSWKGKYYILPEAAESKKLFLYEAKDFPHQWIKKCCILEEELYDATLVNHENIWYLFATKKYHPSKSADQYLNIYYADNLLSNDWTGHPQNPIKSTVLGSRPAGGIFKYHNKLIRPAQIGAPKYGYGINFYEILKLTKTEFKEEFFDKIEPDFEEGILASHTFNSVNGLSVIDVQRRE